MRKLTPWNLKAIMDFVAHAGPHTAVRTVRLANKLNCKELRTKRFTHLAESWDELGNVTILTSHRVVLNLTREEYEATRIPS